LLIGTTNEGQLRQAVIEESLSQIPRELPDPLPLGVVDPRRWINAR